MWQPTCVQHVHTIHVQVYSGHTPVVWLYLRLGFTRILNALLDPSSRLCSDDRVDEQIVAKWVRERHHLQIHRRFSFSAGPNCTCTGVGCIALLGHTVKSGLTSEIFLSHSWKSAKVNGSGVMGQHKL